MLSKFNQILLGISCNGRERKPNKMCVVAATLDLICYFLLCNFFSKNKKPFYDKLIGHVASQALQNQCALFMIFSLRIDIVESW